MGDWLGTGSVANFNKVYIDFLGAKEFVNKLGLKTYSDWSLFSKSGNRPDDIPSHPDQTYKNSGWKGWPDFLGKK